MIAQRLWLALALTFLALADTKTVDARDPDIGKSYRVPYKLTDTNHFLVRVRINGKGPFNFLVDTGAPAFYVSTETAKKIGLKADEEVFWTPVGRVDFEGGATLRNLNARVEDPFQLVGMNALGLPGASIDGILGFTVLARFKLELDPTNDRMTWTRLDYEPADPPAPPRQKPGDAPGGMQAMNALGPLAKVAAAFLGKQPEDERVLRGFLGIELSEHDGDVRVDRVLDGSPASKAGVRLGDTLVRIAGRSVHGVKGVRTAVAEIKSGDAVVLVVRREGTPDELSLNASAGEGL